MDHYLLIADLFVYPNDRLYLKIDEAQKYFNENYPPAAKNLFEFTNLVSSIPLWKWEEIYTRSFDVQALTTLDMGYVLFGDDYKRGELLVNLNNEHKKAENDCGTELADHLPNLLRLIVKLDNHEIKDDLIFLIIVPALRKIISEFESNAIDKKNEIYKKHHKTLINREENKGKAYQWLLLALLDVLKADFPESQPGTTGSNSFSQEISNELEIQS